MSGGSKKWLGVRGALLAGGLMLGTAGTAFAGAPASTQDKHKWVEVHKYQSSRGDRGDDSEWTDSKERRRYEERQRRLEQRAEERGQRYEERQRRLEQRAEERRQRYEEQRRREEERRRQLARRYHDQRRREYGTGGSGYSHPYDSWKRHEDHKHHQHRPDGSCYERHGDGRRY